MFITYFILYIFLSLYNIFTFFIYYSEKKVNTKRGGKVPPPTHPPNCEMVQESVLMGMKTVLHYFGANAISAEFAGANHMRRL